MIPHSIAPPEIRSYRVELSMLDGGHQECRFMVPTDRISPDVVIRTDGLVSAGCLKNLLNDSYSFN